MNFVGFAGASARQEPEDPRHKKRGRLDLIEEARAMWLFLRRRMVRFLLFAVAVPLIGGLAIRAGDKLEDRRGPTTTATGLRKLGFFLKRRQPAGRRAS